MRMSLIRRLLVAGTFIVAGCWAGIAAALGTGNLAVGLFVAAAVMCFGLGICLVFDAPGKERDEPER